MFDTASEIAEYLVRVTAQAGDPLTLPRLQCLLLLVNGHHLAQTGSPIFRELTMRAEAGPEVPSVTRAYAHHAGPIVLPPGLLPTMAGMVNNIPAIVKGVLRDFGAMSGFQLREHITNSALWEVSMLTQNQLEHGNIMAWFRAQKPLTMKLDRNWPEVDFPIKKVEGFDAAAHQVKLSEMVAEDLAEKEREAQKQVERSLWAIGEAERLAEEMKPKPQTASPISRLVSLFSGKGV